MDKHDTCLDLIPKDLLNEILFYIEDQADFFKLNEFENFKSVLNDKFLWKNLFQFHLGYLNNYININYDNTNIYYIAYNLSKAIKAKIKAIKKLNEMIELTNTYIREYYPNMSVENVDLNLLDKDRNYDKLMEKSLSINIHGDYLTDLSLILELKNLEHQENITNIRELINSGDKISLITLNVSFANYSISVMTSEYSDHFDTTLTKDEFIGILFHLQFNANNEDFDITKTYM